jgi:hypothetical protein
MEYLPSTTPAAALAIATRPIQPVSQFTSMPLALEVVFALRAQQAALPELRLAVLAIKQAQCRRFRHSYSDVLAQSDWSGAAKFFLSELYGDRDYSQRDTQFARIAPAMERLFPPSVIGVATLLAQLHALSKQLDHAMGWAWLSTAVHTDDLVFSPDTALLHYVRIWRLVGQSNVRDEQLALVLSLGEALAKLTRTPGLRMMLRLMRGPAHAAGLQHLQGFLEQGFDTFTALQRSKSGVSAFLSLISARETSWLVRLFDTKVTSFSSAILWPELE